MNDAETITTADLYLAAALVVSGHRPKQLFPEGHRTLFSFDPCPAVRNLVIRYYKADLKVDALSYAEAVRSAKGAAINVAGRGAR